MRFVDDSKIVDVVAHARQIEKMVRNNDPEAADRIKAEIDDLTEHKLSIVVVGLLKRGKSTFCNALLGRRDDMIAPVGRFPVTGIITHFYRSDREYAVVHFNNGSAQEIGYEQIGDFVIEERNHENNKDVKGIEVFGKFDLDDDIALVDLPGEGSIHEYHSEVVYKYLPAADIVIFLSSADDPISFSELKLLRKVQPNEMKKVFFVVNKADHVDAQDLADAIAHDRRTIANANINIENDVYSISARQAMQGDFSGFDLLRLRDDIRSVLNNERLTMHLKSFAGRVMAIAQPVFRDIERQGEFSGKSVAELEKEIAALQEKKAFMERELETGLEEFSDNWDEMLDDFKQKLPEIKSRVESNIIGGLEAMSPLTINKKTISELPEKISSTMERELKDSCEALTRRAAESLNKLGKSCPNVSNFLSDQFIDVSVEKLPEGLGNWVFLLTSGAATGATFWAITSAFSAGSSLAIPSIPAVASIPIIGGSLNGALTAFSASLSATVSTAVGTAASIILGPLFIIGAVGTTAALGAMAVGVFRKKKWQKDTLIKETQRALEKAFETIRLERIDHLAKEKDELIKRIRREFDKRVAKVERELRDALAQKHAGETARLIKEQRKAILADYNIAADKLIEEVKCLEMTQE